MHIIILSQIHLPIAFIPKCADYKCGPIPPSAQGRAV